jgi:hypothetical protein
MITNKDTATQISALMLEIGAKLDTSVALVQDTCEELEFNRYRRVVGELMGTMLLEVMNPLYQTHPDLKPARLR